MTRELVTKTLSRVCSCRGSKSCNNVYSFYRLHDFLALLIITICLLLYHLEQELYFTVLYEVSSALRCATVEANIKVNKFCSEKAASH